MKSRNAPWLPGAPAVILAVVLAPIPAVAAETKPDAAGIEFFEKKVRPVLAAHCFACHSAGKKRRGNLLLDSRAGLLKGGDNGPALVPGNPDRSLMVKAISYKDELRMPPRSRLSDVQIADLTAWVKRGAPWPGGDGSVVGPSSFDFEKRRCHWSLQPVRPVVPPRVKRVARARTPIDHFLLAKLEARGLVPAEPANRRTLLRRMTYDLTGLPPRPDEVQAFLTDRSANALEKVIDRLLASPAYGERWGRHWLDLMRFAETSGHEFDLDIPHAWLYRDHVVRAFNDDVPYDRMVREHIASDLMADPRRRPVERTNESILGTGFWFLGESKHSPVDVRADGSDRRDNMIDVFGKTFLGLTIACARCHDHKFDAIYTKDYYSLVSYLQSSRMQHAFLDEPERFAAPARTIRELRAEAGALATRLSVSALEAKLSGLAAALEAARKTAPSPVADALKKVDPRQARQLFRPWRILGDPALRTGAAFLAKKRELLLQLQGEARQADEADKRYVAFADFQKSGYRDWFLAGDAFGEAPAGVNNVEIHPGKPIPVRRLIGPGVASSNLTSARLQGALRSRTFTIEKKHILYRARGRGVRINVIIDGFQLIRNPIYGGLTFTINDDNPRWYVQNLGMWVGQKAYIEVLDDGRGSIELDRVLFSDAGAPPAEQANPLLVKLVEDAAPETFAKAYQKLLRETVQAWRDGKLSEKENGADRVDLLNAILSSEVVAALPGVADVDRTRRGASDVLRLDSAGQLAKLMQAVAAAEASLPEPRRGLALTDGTGVNERVSIRGNHKTPGEEAPRRLLVALGGDRQPLPTAGSGRLDLAMRLTSHENPLLARVMVNRLWHHHFGAGIVRSVDNFGIQGERPTHPELLDWLAAEFVRSGWSIKHMHRLILRSSAYQMQSKNDDAGDRADPRNELLHRMSIRRLEAEAVRDAMLAVSGRLDRTMFGRGPLPHLTPFMIGRGRPGSGPLDGAGRRSLYLNVRRNFLNPMFLAFDYPIPFTAIGRRSVSNVPAQALTLLNNPFVTQQARLWADRSLAAPGNNRERVERMYESAFGRMPTPMELTEALEFLTEQGKEHGREDVRAWADLAHVLFNVKEFVFVN